MMDYSQPNKCLALLIVGHCAVVQEDSHVCDEVEGHPLPHRCACGMEWGPEEKLLRPV